MRKACILLLFWYLLVAKELPLSCSWRLSSAVELCSGSIHFLFFKWKHKSLAAYVYMLFLGFPLAAAGVSLLLSCSHFLCLWCLYLSGSSLATGSLWTVSMWIKGFDYKFVPVLTHPVTWWWSVKFAVINALLDGNVCGRLPENKPCQKHAGVMFGTPVFLVWKSFRGIARTSMRGDLHSCGVGWIASFS